MNEMKLFENPEFGAIRTVEVGGEPWLVGKDVAQALGYSDTSDALKRHVDPEDKLTRRFADSGQSREMYIINESGLYSLVLSSKLPGAKKFKRWVTSEVLKAAKGDAKAAKVLFDLLGEQGAAGAGGMQDMDDDPITASLKEEMGNGLL